MGDTRCLVIDADLPGMSGLELQSHLASAGRHIPIIFITASPDETARAQACEVGALDLFRKTSGERALLKEILSTLRVKDENEVPTVKPDSRRPEDLLVSVIDDDGSIRRAMERLIRSFGFPVVTFPSAHEFLLSGHERDTACLILDMQMPKMNGLQLQSHLAHAGCRIPIIFITAFPEERVRVRAFQAGAVDFLEKPFRDDALLDAIRRALRISNKDGLPR